MEEIISRWILETLHEYEKAKKNQNLFKMTQMIKLEKALKTMRAKLLES